MGAPCPRDSLATDDDRSNLFPPFAFHLHPGPGPRDTPRTAIHRPTTCYDQATSTGASPSDCLPRGAPLPPTLDPPPLRLSTSAAGRLLSPPPAMSQHPATSRAKPPPPGNEEAAATLNLGEFQEVDTLTLSEAALVINALVAKRRNDRKNVNDTECVLPLVQLTEGARKKKKRKKGGKETGKMPEMAGGEGR